MKKIFSIFLVCCATFVFANDEPVFEETDEDTIRGTYRTFVAEEPIFEEDDETADEKKEPCDKCKGSEDQDSTKEGDETAIFNRALLNRPQYEESGEDHDRFHGSYVSWRRFKANFGIEKIFVRFPQRPAVSQSNSLLTAYAYDHAVLYSITGYYPPVGNIDPSTWFYDALYALKQYPYSLVNQAIFQASNGDWVLDYVAHDYVQNLIIKGRSIISPFNAYTIQCVKPNGSRDYFDYFLDSFWIKCDCQ